MEVVTGGWQYEGKEKPHRIRICYKCQGIHRNDPTNEINRENWCDDCLAGKLLGHKPRTIVDKPDL